MIKWLIGSVVVLAVFIASAIFVYFYKEEGECENIREDSWIILTTKNVDVEELEDYSLVIFDPENHPSLEPLKEEEIQIYGLLDLAKSYGEDHLFGNGKRKTEQILRTEVRNQEDIQWIKTFVNEKIPKMVDQGFTGLVLAGLEDLPKVAHQDREKISKLLVQLVYLIKLAHPDMPLMIQNGYTFLPVIGHSADSFMGTSIVSEYDVKSGTYKLLDKRAHQDKVDRLKELRFVYGLRIFTLDYWDPSDFEMIGKIYEMEEENCFRPYVGNKKLDRVVK